MDSNMYDGVMEDSPASLPPDTVTRWGEELSRIGCRLTGPRQAILEVIAGRDAPFTAEELVDALRGQGIGRATVFRTIDLLAEMDLLHRIHGVGCHMYTACPPGHHHHLVCSSCGRTVNVDLCGLEEQMAALARETNFAIDRHYLEFSGRCSTCRPV